MQAYLATINILFSMTVNNSVLSIIIVELSLWSIVTFYFSHMFLHISWRSYAMATYTTG